MTHRHPQRMLSGLLGLLLLLPLLVACGGAASEPAEQATSAPAGEATAAATTAAEATEAPATTEETAATEEAAAEATAPAAADDGEEKVLIIGYNQFPDTLLQIASQSSMTTQVTQFFQPGCITLLDFEFQPVCFDELPSAENGGLISETVTIEAADVSEENPVILNGEIVTDSAQITQTLELPQLSATWTIREGIAWQDGTPLTADDFVFTYELQTNPDIPVATSFTAQRTVAIEKVDDRTVRWTGRPGFVDPTFMTNFVIDNSSYNVLPAHILRDVPAADLLTADWSQIGFAYGPFQIEDYTPQESITLVRNPNFWGASEGLPRVDRVIIEFLTDEDQVLAQLQSGEIDIAGTIGLTLNSADTLDELKAAGTHDVQFVPATVWEQMSFGIQRGDGQPSFFEDVRVRQAFAFGINRQQIVDEVLGGRTRVMNSFQPEDYWAFPGNDQLEAYAFDAERANQLLDEAGWTVGADGIREQDGRPFSIDFYTTEGNRTRQTVAQIIQANLREIGVDVRLNFVPATEVLFRNGEEGILAGRRFDLAMFAWQAGPEPSANLYLCAQIPTAENGWVGQNNPGYCNPEFDAAALPIYNLLTREDRTPFINESQIIFNRDLPTLPLYQRLQIAAFRTGVTGVEINPSTFVDFSFPEQLDITQ